MYDSLITLIQMLDNSEKPTFIQIYTPFIIINVGIKVYTYRYSQEGISKAIEELENLL